MTLGKGQVFLRGLAAGALGTFLGASATLYTMSRFGWIRFGDSSISSPGDWLHWAYTNLGSSIPVFAILLLAYFITLGRLRDALRSEQHITKIVHFDHLTDIWTTLFFGAGVIWTAIGMRSALIFALGDREAALAQGAFAMLERMIDGGILLALSTTIFGGVGGYSSSNTTRRLALTPRKCGAACSELKNIWRAQDALSARLSSQPRR